MQEDMNEVKVAITKLTVIQEGQQEQAEKQSEFNQTILQAINEMNLVRSIVDNNSKDIDRLGSKLDENVRTIMLSESTMNTRIAENKEELKTLTASKLWQGITAGVAVTVFLFGYIYMEVHTRTNEVKSSVNKLNTEVKQSIDKLSAVTTDNTVQTYHVVEVVKTLQLSQNTMKDISNANNKD